MGGSYREAQRLIRAAIDGHRMLSPGQAIVLGFSGGADSLALAHLMTELNSRTAAAGGFWPCTCIRTLKAGIPTESAARPSVSG